MRKAPCPSCFPSGIQNLTTHHFCASRWRAPSCSSLPPIGSVSCVSTRQIRQRPLANTRSISLTRAWNSNGSLTREFDRDGRVSKLLVSVSSTCRICPVELKAFASHETSQRRSAREFSVTKFDTAETYYVPLLVREIFTSNDRKSCRTGREAASGRRAQMSFPFFMFGFLPKK